MNFLNFIIRSDKYFIKKDLHEIELYSKHDKIMVARKDKKNTYEIIDYRTDVYPHHLRNIVDNVPIPICDIIDKYSEIGVRIGNLKYIPRYKRLFTKNFNYTLKLLNNVDIDINYEKHYTKCTNLTVHNHITNNTYQNNRPTWNVNIQRYTLRFYQHGIIPSMRNLQILKYNTTDDNDNMFIELGKMHSEFYILNVNKVPLDEAFGIALANLI